ncbi:hypothetical protein [Enterococcus sp. LJL51]|uniref:hypothetical protein n=1 Tax=Enterococcus sp. LJL51 TaxID=3416656 RepID=UPI003CE7B799
MTYPKIKESMCCAHCQKELSDSFVTVRDNFLIVKFFQFADGEDNIFCDNDCLANYLSAEEILIEGSEQE